MSDVMSDAQDLFEYTQFLRRDFHRFPELGFQETRSAGVIANELNQLGLQVTTGVAKTGVVALLEGAQPGPVVLLRFDMDALPVLEDTGAEYASQNTGVMHACGHDGHMAVGLTVARMLAAQREQLKGSVKFMFQPAEETAGGAEGMLKAGILDNPRVDWALSMHLWNERPAGMVSITDGPMMSGADIFHVNIEGKGGHGALPHTTIDPLVALAHIVTSVQTIVGRNVSPLDAAVVSVCSVKGGEAFNVIPQSAELSGTIRTFRPEVRAKVVERLGALVKGVAEAYGCQASLKVQQLTPAVVNDPQVAQRLREAISQITGLTIEDNFRTMPSEDMAYVLQKVPGCYVMIGSANAARGLNYGHHHPKFDFDEAALSNGAAVMVAGTLALLG